MTDLRDKTIVITGASSGIGAATAVACAEAGMRVVLNARRAERLAALAERLGGAERAIVVAGDVADAGLSVRMLDEAEARFGDVHAVFANAGYGLDRMIHETDDAALRAIFETNFFASAGLVREAARRLVGAGRPGHLLMCSSCLSKFTLAGHGAYSATKAAQNHLCRAMGLELHPHGIHVSSVHPITTRTELFTSARERAGDDSFGTGEVPDHTPRLLVQPAERVARAVVKCLHRPRPEVWTSFTVRAVAAAMTLSPAFADWAMRRAMNADGKGEGTEARRHEGTEG